MKILKDILTMLIALSIGVGFCWLIMTAIVQEQEQREASAIQRIQRVYSDVPDRFRDGSSTYLMPLIKIYGRIF
jgi:hypothetical protein